METSWLEAEVSVKTEIFEFKNAKKRKLNANAKKRGISRTVKAKDLDFDYIK